MTTRLQGRPAGDLSYWIELRFRTLTNLLAWAARAERCRPDSRWPRGRTEVVGEPAAREGGQPRRAIRDLVVALRPRSRVWILYLRKPDTRYRSTTAAAARALARPRSLDREAATGHG